GAADRGAARAGSVGGRPRLRARPAPTRWRRLPREPDERALRQPAERPGARHRVELEQEPGHPIRLAASPAASRHVGHLRRRHRASSEFVAPRFDSARPEYTGRMAVIEAAERHEELLHELIETVAAYKPEFDRDLLERAFAFAARAHDGQQRRSGEDFIHHPFGVAKICAELHLDEQTIAAALLHDVVEDTETAIEDVKGEFGAEIAHLVEGVTKLTRVQFASREHAEAENYRKLIVAMAQDVRVILIKLADRL